MIRNQHKPKAARFMKFASRIVLPILAFVAATLLHSQKLPRTLTAITPLTNPYRGRPLDNAITRLQEKIDRGEIALEYDAYGTGYLRALLRALDIDADSQLLVFSKTS